jgi:ZIP family zinc transporter
MGGLLAPESAAILLLALLSGSTSLLGAWLAVRLGRNTRAIGLGIGFSGGIMILISTIELIPEAWRGAGPGPTLTALLAGAALLAGLNFVVPHRHLEDEAGAFGGSVRSAYLIAAGLVLHDFPEGFAMANCYVASPSLGLLVALAIALHNVPEEFAMAAPLVLVKRKRALYVAAFVSALAEPLGALVGLAAVQLNQGLNPLLMAFAAGAMLFVSGHELLPMARRSGNIGPFVAGAGISVPVHLALSALVSR